MYLNSEFDRSGAFHNSVILADALALMDNMGKNSADMLLTDIPYGVVNRSSGGLRNLDKEYADDLMFDLGDFCDRAYNVTKGNGVIFCGREQISPLYAHFHKEKCSVRLIVWEKTNPSPMNGTRLFLSGIETAVHFRKPKATFNGHCLNTVFRFPSGRGKIHPTEKPLPLFKRLIELLSDPGQVVLDPCAGSGTTAVACKEMDRVYICGDVNEDCVEMARERLR